MTNNWYQCARQYDSKWLPLRFDEISNAWVVQYVKALKVDDQLIGYINLSLNITEIDQLVDKLDTGDDGYVIIFDKQQQQIYHSLYHNAHGGMAKTFSEIFPTVQQSEIRDLALNELLTIQNVLTEKLSFLDLAEIDNTDWIISVVIEREFFAHDELLGEVTALASTIEENHHMVTFIVVFTLICWVGLFTTILHEGVHGRIWWSALCITISFISGIIYIWVEQQMSDPDLTFDTVIVTNEADLREFVKDYSKTSLQAHKVPPIFVPTGVALQSMRMGSDNNLKLTGYVWQRYMLANNFDIERGVVFPESSETEMELVYDEVADGFQTLGWSFETIIPEHFEYETYPFDKQLVWLRIWPQEYLKHVVLIPDIDSYDNMNTSNKPGLETDFTVGGWRVERAFFDIRQNDFNSNLGIANRANKNGAPELHYNISISRNFIDPFVSYLFPVIIVLVMLYAVLLTNSKDEARIGLVGFNALEVLASASSFFFCCFISPCRIALAYWCQ